MKQWSQLWLSYHPVENSFFKPYASWVILEGFEETEMLRNISDELQRGLKNMLGVRTDFTGSTKELFGEHCIRIRKTQEMKLQNQENLCPTQIQESYRIFLSENADELIVEAQAEQGAFYGVFALLRGIATRKKPCDLTGCFIPDNPLRMLNHWDNITGSIERGYSGNSFFFRNAQILVNERTRDYARLMASIGINGVVINNVNVIGDATYLVTDRYVDMLKELSVLLCGYGIRLFLSLNFAAPMEIGNLLVCDPLDLEVIAWWEKTIEGLFENIPNLGGFLVKADSEGRPGPFSYGRTQADGANMLADLLLPYGGLLIWRCFVYNCRQDWRDRKTDRASAAYESFQPLDGKFRKNVILQIKNGPVDFQIREPVHPLFGAMPKTNQMLEVQITQEYTGQQIDVCYLVPMFKEVLEFRTYCDRNDDRVKDIVSGRTFGNGKSGMAGIAGVSNTGDDACWTGSDLAAANLYGYGRLAFHAELTAQDIAKEWATLTFGSQGDVTDVIVSILMDSRNTYEKYTSPLGVGWMVEPADHYSCSVDGYEYSRWGTYHRADRMGMGVDRSVHGTGYVLQYFPQNAQMFNDPTRCPENLLLFFHHVPYTWRLHNNKTLIQHIYDTHFEGVEEVAEMIRKFQMLKGLIPDEVYDRVLDRFERQLDHAREWRDQVNASFYIKSGIPDEKNRKIY